MKMITKKQFEDDVVFVPGMLAETILLEIGQGYRPVTQCEQHWFIQHVNYRLRYLYSTQPRWEKELKKDTGRDYAWAFVEHWAKAFVKNIKRYIDRHPVELIHEVIETERPD